MGQGGKKILKIVKYRPIRQAGPGAVVRSTKLKDYVGRKAAIVVYDEFFDDDDDDDLEPQSEPEPVSSEPEPVSSEPVLQSTKREDIIDASGPSYLDLETGQRYKQLPEGAQVSNIPIKLGFHGKKETKIALEEIEFEKELKRRLGLWVKTEDGRLEVNDGAN